MSNVGVSGKRLFVDDCERKSVSSYINHVRGPIWTRWEVIYFSKGTVSRDFERELGEKRQFVMTVRGKVFQAISIMSEDR
jgi:hypothetical protein